MRAPLTKLELESLLTQVKTAEDRDRLRRIIAHAVKAIDTGRLAQAREILWGAL